MTAQIDIDQLFSARRVAIIGASARSVYGTGNNVIRNLQRSGFGGEIIVVHPTADLIEGLAVVRAIEDIDPVDVAVVAVGGPKVPAVLASLENAGCRAAVVMSVGLDEADLQAVRSYRADGRMLVHGPNCMGLIGVADSLRLWAEDDNLAGLPLGDIALVSQSGSGAIFVARGVQGAGFSRIISTGNEAATSTADYIAWLATDPETSVIGIVIESIADVAAFRSAAILARRAEKPIVALKVGRSENGARATAAHTGALLSSDSAYQALFDELGIPLVGDYDELSNALELISILGSRSVGLGRVGVITISGGQAALAADIAESAGVTIPDFSETSRRNLDEILLGSPVNNPLDAAAVAGVGEDEFGAAITAVGADPAIDAVVVVLDAQVTLSESELEFEHEYFATALSAECAVPVIVASCSSHTLADVRVSRGPVPVVRGLRNAFVAIGAAARSTVSIPEVAIRPRGLPSEDQVRELEGRLSLVSGPVTGALLTDILTAYGVPTVDSAVFTSGVDAAAFADSLGYPVVVKVQSPDILHRTEVGGVVQGISDAAGVEAAVADIASAVRAHHPEARIEGFEVQRQLRHHLEAFTGFVVDSALGANVGVGLGGTLIELLPDARHALAPLSPGAAESLIEQTALGKLLAGYRAIHPVTPTEGLVDLVCRLSWLGHDLARHLEAADLNPVLVEEVSGDARIVDALLISRGGASPVNQLHPPTEAHVAA